MKRPRVLFVDDDDTIRRVLAREMEAFGYEVCARAGPEAIEEVVREFSPDVGLLDLRLPGMNGIELMQRVHEVAEDVPIVILTGEGAVPDAVEAVRKGAFDFLTKPASLDLLRSTLESAMRYAAALDENKRLRRIVQRDVRDGRILGDSPAMVGLRRMIERIAQGGASVLVQGESGTGKELVARSLHAASSRSDNPFVVVNCGAITESLIASELFGHEKGAFTGAVARRTGLFEAADGGTVFLDEIGELPLAVQPALLRGLQFGEIQAVGSQRVRSVDVRVIAATNRDLAAGIAEGWFREDLYYRLATIVLEIPPLRERSEDVAVLAESFLAESGMGREPSWGFAPEAFDRLKHHSWRGNARELENAVIRLLTLAPGPVITAADVDELVLSRHQRATGPLPTLDLQELERLALAEAMQRHGGDKRAVAAELGVALKTVYNKLARYGMGG